MASQVLEIIIRAKNQAKKDMAEVSGAVDGLNSKLKGARPQLLLAGAAITGMGIASIKLASDLQEAQSAAEAVFKSSADVVHEFAQSTAADFNVTRASAYEYTAQLGAIFKASGLTEQAAAEQSVEFTKLAADLASFKNLRFEDALQKIRAGLVGEAEPLRQVGVLLSEAKVQQIAYARGIAEAGEKLTDAQKVAARQIIIMEDLADAHGDVERTAGSVANQMKNVQQELADAGATLGTQLLPHVSTLLKHVAALVGWFAELDKDLQTVIVVLGVAAGAMVALGLAIPPVIALMTALGVASNVALAGIPLLIFGIIAGVTLLILKWQEVKTFMEGTGGWILAAFGPIGIAAKLVIDNFDAIKEAVRSTFNFVVDMVNTQIESFNLLIEALNKVTGVFGVEISKIDFHMAKWEKGVEDLRKTYSEFTIGATDELETLVEAHQEAQEEIISVFNRGADQRAMDLERSLSEERRLIREAKDAEFAARIAEDKRRADHEVAVRDVRLRSIEKQLEAEQEMILAAEQAKTLQLIDQERARAKLRNDIIEDRVRQAAIIAGIDINEVYQSPLSEAAKNARGEVASGGGFESMEDAIARGRRVAEARGLEGDELDAFMQDWIRRQQQARDNLNDIINPGGAADSLPLLTGSVPDGATLPPNVTVTNIFEGPVTSQEAADAIEESLQDLDQTGRGSTDVSGD